MVFSVLAKLYAFRKACRPACSRQVGFELLMCAVVIALDGGFFDSLVHAFYLAVGPGMSDFSQAVFNVMLMANTVKEVHRCKLVLFAMGKLGAVIAQEGVYFIRQGSNNMAQELYCGCFGPICASWTKSRRFHFATVFGVR